ncbi:hypothetical protein EIP86_001651 [Pleurotus ostreatoroseus]|nr:hypothetical protein EIP86_001651 [Pleurotus ostreatoroseus]
MKLEVNMVVQALERHVVSGGQGIEVLPIELVEQTLRAVIDGTDMATILSCTLVCKRWNAICRLYVFQHIKIVSEDRMNELKALLDSKPEIGPHIHELEIEAAPLGTVPEPLEWVANFPSVLSSHLTQVRTIEFIGLWEAGEILAGSTFFHDLTEFKTVTKLTVRYSFVTLNILQAFACALPNLQDLQIGETFQPPIEFGDAPAGIYDPSLSSLHIHAGQRFPEATDLGLTWALSTKSRWTLQSLSSLVYFNVAQALTDHLTMLGDQLRHLELRLGMQMGTTFEYEMIKEDLHIHACTGLETLALYCTLPACPCIMTLLAEISSPSIQKVSITIFGNDVASLSNCQALAEPLDGHNLRNLDEVRFMYRGDLPLEIVFEKLCEDLPSIHRRGILRVMIPRINPCHEPGFPKKWDFLGPWIERQRLQRAAQEEAQAQASAS